MRAVFRCIGLWFLTASPACGQFTILSDMREVRATATVRYLDTSVPPPGVIREVTDSQTLVADPLLPFEAEAAAFSRLPNWQPTDPPLLTVSQSSRVSSSEIFATGRPDDAIGGTSIRSGAQSRIDVRFFVNQPTNVRVRYERFDPGFTEPIPIQVVHRWGGAELSITGPTVDISVPDKTSLAFNVCQSMGLPDCIPDTISFDQVMAFGPGEYVLHASAGTGVGFTGDPTANLSVSFIVHLTAVPIPEPSSILLAIAALTLPFWKVAKRKGFSKRVAACVGGY